LVLEKSDIYILHRFTLLLFSVVSTLQTASGESGVKLGGQAELTLGPYGRAANIDLNLSSRGPGGTVSVALSKGIFGALSVVGGILGARHATNATFYIRF
jgi:lipid-binding SYLF domain-containing protein